MKKQWWRTLSQNPIYRREKGEWGKPNPFYENLNRFSPFVLLGTLGLGACTGFINPALLSDNDGLFALQCLLCIPTVLLTAFSLFGTMMAPALTAPSISIELDRGTWDILRLTPQSTHHILLAKLFGALARLSIWRLLFVLSMIQGLVIGGSLMVFTSDSFIIRNGLIGLGTVLRPWAEILFAAFTGMYVSTWVRSAMMALVISYSAVILAKLFNNTLLWFALSSLWAKDGSVSLLLGSTVGPTAVFIVAIIILWFGIAHQAEKIQV